MASVKVTTSAVRLRPVPNRKTSRTSGPVKSTGVAEVGAAAAGRRGSAGWRRRAGSVGAVGPVSGGSGMVMVTVARLETAALVVGDGVSEGIGPGEDLRGGVRDGAVGVDHHRPLGRVGGDGHRGRIDRAVGVRVVGQHGDRDGHAMVVVAASLRATGPRLKADAFRVEGQECRDGRRGGGGGEAPCEGGRDVAGPEDLTEAVSSTREVGRVEVPSGVNVVPPPVMAAWSWGDWSAAHPSQVAFCRVKKLGV